jgi:hypothetical protein
MIVEMEKNEFNKLVKCDERCGDAVKKTRKVKNWESSVLTPFS